LGVTPNNEAETADTCNNGGVHGELTVGTSAVELKVGALVLPLRKYITMTAKDNEVYWGYDNTVTTTTGTRLFKNALMVLPIGAGTTVFFIANVAGRKVNIGELA